MNSITVKYFDINWSKNFTHFLDMGVSTGVSKTETLFQPLYDCMNDHWFAQNSLISFLVDNASGNLDRLHLVKSRMLQKNWDYCFLDCSCHIFHNMQRNM